MQQGMLYFRRKVWFVVNSVVGLRICCARVKERKSKIYDPNVIGTSQPMF
jgi:hypothetical protein